MLLTCVIRHGLREMCDFIQAVIGSVPAKLFKCSLILDLQQCLFSVKIGTHKLEHSLPQSKIERTNF